MKKLNHKEIRTLESGDLIEVTLESSPIVKGHLQDIKVTSTFVELIFKSRSIQVPTLETSSDKVEVFSEDKFDKFKTPSYAKMTFETESGKLDEVKNFIEKTLVDVDSISDCYDGKCLAYVPTEGHILIRDLLEGTFENVSNINIKMRH
jgi:hypothetical protein